MHFIKNKSSFQRLAAIFIILSTGAFAHADSTGWRGWKEGWYGAIYLGQLTDSDLADFATLDTDFKDSLHDHFRCG
jgi:hypothetical protein